MNRPIDFTMFMKLRKVDDMEIIGGFFTSVDEAFPKGLPSLSECELIEVKVTEVKSLGLMKGRK